LKPPVVGEFHKERLEKLNESNEKKSKKPYTMTTFIEIIKERVFPEPELNLTCNDVSDSHLVHSVVEPAREELGV
jgi:hypothetical protein